MERQSTSTIAISALIGLLLAISAPRVMAANECGADQSQPVLPRNGSSISGHGTLVVNNEGADVVMRVENLTPGVAYTTWFLYFDKTAECLVAVPMRELGSDYAVEQSGWGARTNGQRRRRGQRPTDV